MLQINGKLRDRIQASATADARRAGARWRCERPRIQAHVDGREVVKVVVVPGKLVNIVVR